MPPVMSGIDYQGRLLPALVPAITTISLFDWIISATTLTCYSLEFIRNLDFIDLRILLKPGMYALREKIVTYLHQVNSWRLFVFDLGEVLDHITLNSVILSVSRFLGWARKNRFTGKDTYVSLSETLTRLPSKLFPKVNGSI